MTSEKMGDRIVCRTNEKTVAGWSLQRRRRLKKLSVNGKQTKDVDCLHQDFLFLLIQERRRSEDRKRKRKTLSLLFPFPLLRDACVRGLGVGVGVGVGVWEAPGVQFAFVKLNKCSDLT